MRQGAKLAGAQGHLPSARHEWHCGRSLLTESLRRPPCLGETERCAAAAAPAASSAPHPSQSAGRRASSGMRAAPVGTSLLASTLRGRGWWRQARWQVCDDKG